MIQNIQNAENANKAYDIYHDRFIELLNKHAPMKKLSKKEIKLRKKPWLTTALLKSISKKRTLFTNFKNEKLKKKRIQKSHSKDTKCTVTY